MSLFCIMTSKDRQAVIRGIKLLDHLYMALNININQKNGINRQQLMHEFQAKPMMQGLSKWICTTSQNHETSPPTLCNAVTILLSIRLIILWAMTMPANKPIQLSMWLKPVHKLLWSLVIIWIASMLGTLIACLTCFLHYKLLASTINRKPYNYKNYCYIC